MSVVDKQSLIKERYPYYLANEPVFANVDLPVTNKYTQEVATRVALADEKAIDTAITAAVNAKEELRKMRPYERKEILLKIAEEMKKRKEELAYLLCIEAGKPLKDSRGEVDRAITTFIIAAEESVRIYGEHASLEINAGGRGYNSITKRFPIGPISMISPFNFPINLAAHKIAPALAVGCPFVLKPASRTPLGALLLGEIMMEVGLPKGSFSILPCSRSGADLFTTDERFDLLSFTGSPSVGWELKSKAGKKKVVLELGGNAACIVDEDVQDVDDAVERIVVGGFYQSGQSCISVQVSIVLFSFLLVCFVDLLLTDLPLSSTTLFLPSLLLSLSSSLLHPLSPSLPLSLSPSLHQLNYQRLIVHEKIYEQVKEKLISRVSTLNHGDPTDESVFIGPLISPADVTRCEEWVNEAKERGAKVLCGGERDGDVFFKATLLEDAPKGTKVRDEEVFGPIVCLSSFSSFKQAIEEVNDSKFGLQAGVFTTNINKVCVLCCCIDV